MRDFQLFTYGTIADPDFFEGLLKRKAIYRQAQLNDYQCLTNPSTGYLFVKPSVGKQVSGKLVDVSTQELDILDRWEEVPLYKRELKTIRSETGHEKAYVYTQNHADGVPIHSNHPHDRASILHEIQVFRTWIDNLLID
ncbi:gamma-glutamylcyclotransferase family protein [Sunxiuqinia sp. sy24]|uniref:gamma-glutamylcyclotransferase family protein n=1 Tax=Sunxiuqinia sp. sy24 TaxID=3461495 RepID=UPI004045A83D